MTDPAPGVRDPIDDHGPMSLGQEPADIAAPPSDAPPNESASTGQLIRSSSIVGAGTLLSRLTGMLRYVAIAVVLGGRTLADGYNLANTTPNMIYDLLLGGVFSATLIPVFVDNRERDDSESTDAVVTVLVTALIIVTVIGVAWPPGSSASTRGTARRRNVGPRSPSACRCCAGSCRRSSSTGSPPSPRRC